MHAISSYRGNRPTNTQDRLQYTALLSIARSVKILIQCHHSVRMVVAMTLNCLQTDLYNTVTYLTGYRIRHGLEVKALKFHHVNLGVIPIGTRVNSGTMTGIWPQLEVSLHTWAYQGLH